MKLKKSHILIPAVIVIALSLIVYQLRSNKKEFKDNIAFAQRKIDKIPVTTEKVNKGVLSENVKATGTLEASEVLNLVSETQGKIIKIYKQKGDWVAAGNIIAKVDDEVISANVLTAEANYEQCQKDVERFTRLSKENAITKRDLEQSAIGLKKAKADLINARKALGNTSIKAPISGYINNDFITEGQLLGGGSPICEIVNNSKLKLNIKVSEAEVYKINKGQSLSIHLSVFPDKTITGHVTSIAEKADAAMTFNVEITLVNNASVHLKSGLYAEVELPVKNEAKIIVSKRSIVGSMENPVVYVAVNGKAVRRELVVNQSNNNQIEILKGLSVGEELIVSGQLNLKDGDDVNIIR